MRLRRITKRVGDTLRSVATGEFLPPLGDVRFLIFAHRRSGSTSLVRALERHPRIRVLNEPFSEDFHRWFPKERDYRRFVTDTRSLDAEMADMYQDVNGIKVLSDQMPRDIYAHMLLATDVRVIFLRRKNLLQAVVSGLIAEQTDVWHSWALEQPIEDAYARLRPLDIDDIRARISTIQDEVAFFGEVISRRNEDDVMKLVYEELYLGTYEERQRTLSGAFAFVGLDPVEPDETEVFMDPSRAKLNPHTAYAFVPNTAEIDAAVGNDETGWLIGRRAPSD